MFAVVTGGSGSGKSEYAEKLVVECFQKHSCNGRLYYIATMQSFDKETEQKIQRHKQLRRGKGFRTQELPIRIEGCQRKKEDVLLIECMSNLLANEMYAKNGRIKERRDSEKYLEEVQEYIVDQLLLLEKEVTDLILVTNEVDSAGSDYDKESLLYMQGIGKINQELSEKADLVVEVVCGIPIVIRDEIYSNYESCYF